MKRKRWVCGKLGDKGRRKWFRFYRDAVAQIGRWARTDPIGVAAGEYYVDGPCLRRARA